MASENDAGFRELMSEHLKKLTDKMVFEGVTPKSGVRKVKAMKRLWRSDSFQMLKSILEEPPIQEGRVRPPLLPKPDQDDQDEIAESEWSPRETTLAKETKEKELDYQKEKEELGALYQTSLENDLCTLQQTAQDLINKLLEDTKTMVQRAEDDEIDELVKQEIIKMMSDIHCFKKSRQKSMKLALEEDKLNVTSELKDYLERDMEIRIKTYRQLLEKVYDYQIRHLEESLSEEFEEKLREKIRTSINKFEFVKNKFVEKQSTDCMELECRLSAEFKEHEKFSENRIESMMEDAIFELQGTEEVEGVKADESDCLLVEKMLLKLSEAGWLSYEASIDDDWEGLVAELLQRYQLLIELILDDKGTQENQYLLSMDRLKYFKNQIAQINQAKLTETYDARYWQMTRAKAKLRAASILDNLIRKILPSPPLSRYSISDLQLRPRQVCKVRNTVQYIKKMTSPLSQFTLRQTQTENVLNNIKKESQTTYKQITRKSLPEMKKAHVYTEEDRLNYIETLKKNPQLYNVFFYAL